MTSGRAWTSTWTWILAAAALLAACDDPSSGHGSAATTPSATASATSAAPPPPPPGPAALPTITLGEHGISVDGQEQPWDKLEGSIAMLGVRKGDAADKDVSVVAMRNAKAHDVALAASLLMKAWHPKTLTVRSPTRDQSQGELVLSDRAHAPECSVVAMIEKDSGVVVWAKGGGAAQRFARGMAGPDLSTSTDAIRKKAAACESPVWLLGAADTVTWGLVFDLAGRAKSEGDGGAQLKPKETVLLPHAPVAGRAVKDE